jgi:hypothetical protein
MRYIVVFIVIALLWWMGNSSTSNSDKFVQSVRILYRQCARWAAASQQDSSEIIRVLHANYATGYLWALKDIVSSQEFENITGENFARFEAAIVKVQDTATKMLVGKCKDLVFVQQPEILKAMYSTN